MANNTPETNENEQQMSIQDVVDILAEKLKYDPQGQQLLNALIGVLNQVIQQNQTVGLVLRGLVEKIQSDYDKDFDFEAFVQEFLASLQDDSDADSDPEPQS
jgi:hypothetical protein